MPKSRFDVPRGWNALWPARVLWLAVAAAGLWSIDGALDDRSDLLAWCVTLPSWLLWGAGVVALMVPSVTGLTVLRMISALAVVTAVTSWIGGADSAAGAAFVVATILFAIVVATGEFGQACVQASAYGDEVRFPLRPPAALLVPVALAAIVWCASMVAAPLLLGSRRWIVGGIVGAVAIALTAFVFPRFHAMTRRWVVLVPAGIVLHDHVVLAETLMVPRRQVLGVNLALAATEAADLTGPAAGHAVEIALTEMVTATLAPTKREPRGTALHLGAFLVAPTRPGAFLIACVGSDDQRSG
jgi:hypothetical protein